jgi:hypothetical protein
LSFKNSATQEHFQFFSEVSLAPIILVSSFSAYWYEKVLSRREEVLKKQRWTSKEELRAGKPRTHDELFGIEGSFRRLEID